MLADLELHDIRDVISVFATLARPLNATMEVFDEIELDKFVPVHLALKDNYSSV